MASDNTAANTSAGSSSYSPKRAKTHSPRSNSGRKSSPNALSPSSSPSPAATSEPPVDNASPANPVVVRGLPLSSLSSLGNFTINSSGSLTLHASKVVSPASKSKSSPSSSPSASCDSVSKASPISPVARELVFSKPTFVTTTTTIIHPTGKMTVHHAPKLVSPASKSKSKSSPSTSPSASCDSVSKASPISPVARELVFAKPTLVSTTIIHPTGSMTVHHAPEVVSPASKSKSKSSPSSSPPASCDSVSKASPISPVARELVFSDPTHLRNTTINHSTGSLTDHAPKVVSPASKSKSVTVHPPGFNFKQDINKDDMVVDNKTSDGKPKQETNMPVPPLHLTVVSCILHGIPQNPHFLSLKNYTPIARKNLKSGWHQVFEETVNQIKSLEILGFWDKAEELWRTIEALECMGYNVIPLRRRVVELTDVTKELMVAELEIKKLKIKAENHRMEKCLIDSMISNLTERANVEQFNMWCVKIQVSNKEMELPKIGSVFGRLASDELVPKKIVRLASDELVM